MCLNSNLTCTNFPRSRSQHQGQRSRMLNDTMLYNLIVVVSYYNVFKKLAITKAENWWRQIFQTNGHSINIKSQRYL